MSKFTSGPWEAYGENVTSDYGFICTGHGASTTNGQSFEQQCNNAKLIAAAPELLQACKNTLNILCSTGYEINKDKTELNLNFFADSMDIISHLKNIVNKVEGEE